MTAAANRSWRLTVTASILLGLVQVALAPASERDGMVLVAARRVTVGTSEAERREIAERFDCHPTWLGDDLPRHEVALSAFWIDRHPVTNSQYVAFVELGENPRWALLAVVSRDGRRVIATGRAGEGAGFSVATNTLFTCLHTDATIEVPPRQQATTRQLFWFIDGTLDDLLNRFQRDFDND